MTSGGSQDDGSRPVDLNKGSDDAPFDPYRFGKPDVPPPPEYAPPGYTPDPPPSTPFGAYPDPPQYGQQPYPGPFYPGQPYQQPPGYGTPPPPYGPHPGYAAAQGNGRATAGMVLGILSIVFCWTTFVDLLLIVPGLVLSILGLTTAKQRGRGRGQAVAGLVCTAIGIVLAVVITVLAVHLVGKCSGVDRGSPAYDRCVRNNL